MFCKHLFCIGTPTGRDKGDS